MKTMSWEKLKDNAVSELNRQFHLDQQALFGITAQIEQVQIGTKICTWRENAKDLKQKAINIIENWDIRRAMKLVALFPDILPKKYSRSIPLAEYDEEGNWILIFN